MTLSSSSSSSLYIVYRSDNVFTAYRYIKPRSMLPPRLETFAQLSRPANSSPLPTLHNAPTTRSTRVYVVARRDIFDNLNRTFRSRESPPHRISVAAFIIAADKFVSPSGKRIPSDGRAGGETTRRFERGIPAISRRKEPRWSRRSEAMVNA